MTNKRVMMKHFLIFLYFYILYCGCCHIHINKTRSNKNSKHKRREIESREVLKNMRRGAVLSAVKL